MLLVITIMYQFHITRLILYPFEIIGTVFHEFGHALTVRIFLSLVYSRLAFSAG